MQSGGDSSAPDGELLQALRARVEVLEQQTRQQAAELRELARSERHYRNLIERAKDGFFVADNHGTYVSSNAALRELLGYTEQELHGKKIEDFVEPADLRRAPLRRRELKQSKRLVTSRKLRRKDGSSVDVEVVASSLDDGHFQAVVRDVSERLRAEHERVRLTEELRHAQKMESIGRLAGGIAHDFNNLLLVVAANATVLRRRQRDLIAPELDTIVAATERGGALTKQLLSLSRARVQAWTAFDVNDVLRGMQDLLSRLMGDGIALELNLEPRPCVVLADPSQVEQVIMNLLVNAHDACAGFGRVLVSTTLADTDGRTQVPIVARDGSDGAAPKATAASAHTAPSAPENDVVLRVQDWGQGMDSETKSRIFEPFFTTKPVGVGTGLGLSMVYSLVTQSGGAISVQSVEGEGSVFELRFAALNGSRACEPREIAGERLSDPGLVQ